MKSISFWNTFKENCYIKSLSDKFKCAVCKVLLTEPYSVCCYFEICIFCKNQLFEIDQKKCKICNKNKNNQSFIDKKLIVELKEIQINCLNSNECLWKGDIISFEDHYDECLFKCDIDSNKLIKKKKEENESNTYYKLNTNYEIYDISQKSQNSSNEKEKEKIEIPENSSNLLIKNQDNKELNLDNEEFKNKIFKCELCNLMENPIENHFKDNIFYRLIYDEINLLKKEKEIQNFEISENRQKMKKFEETLKYLENDKENQNIKFSQNKQKIIKLEENIKLLKKEKENQNIEISKNKEKITKLEERMKDEINTKNLEISKLRQEIQYLKDQNNPKDLIKIDETINNYQINKNNPNVDSPEKITLNHGSAVFGLLKFSENLLITVGFQEIKFWNCDDYNLIHCIPNAHTYCINSLRKLNENQFITGSGDKSIKIWDIETKKTVKIFTGHTNRIWDLLVLLNKRIASASGDNMIKIWDVNSNDSIATLQGHTNVVWSLIEMKEDEIISCSNDKTIRFWNLMTNCNTKTILAHSTSIYSLVKISDSMFASGSKEIKIWDFPNGVCLRTLQGHTDNIFNLILVDCNIIASGSNDKCIKIWNILTGDKLNTLTGHTDCVNRLVKVNESHLASGGKDYNLIIWKNFKKMK